MYYFGNLEKTPFNFVMGDMLDQCEYLTQKGKQLWDLISMLRWYARQLCLIHDYNCCSNANETLASYANGRYDYYGVEQIEEFVAFKAAYEMNLCLKSMKL